MRLPTRPRPAAAAALLALALLALPAIAAAHAVVFPRASAPGAYEKYVLRVPNEKGVPTTRVEIRFPADVKVVSFGDVAGWTLQVLTDSARRVTGAVWTGTLPPERFVEFPFVAVNPKTDARLVWPAFQTYADGERVEWTGPEGSKSPASATEIRAASSDAAGAPAAASASTAPAGGGGGTGTWISVAALVLSLISLGLALRPAVRR